MQINKPQLIRLTKYIRTLYKLRDFGMTKVFAANLADPIGVPSHIVRKDFSTLGILGNKKGGFDIEQLIERISNLLGKDKQQKAILIGLGRIGSALLHYNGFKKAGIEIVAGFDLDRNKTVSDGEVPLLPVDSLDDFLKDNPVSVAILAVPEEEAISLFVRLKALGVRGFMNFSPVELKCATDCNKELCPTPCVVNNINIGVELEHIFYQLNLLSQHRGAAVEEEE